jgi:hypothetical protein
MDGLARIITYVKEFFRPSPLNERRLVLPNLGSAEVRDLKPFTKNTSILIWEFNRSFAPLRMTIA